ncbi:hypothetical protein TcWFU_000164 [Taenia crassiceps]|uniref:Uncharacterized protein n=1 Tax=Taenia crassiceps TaxID=6207 RepID=A0ABR4QAA0_9CEST
MMLRVSRHGLASQRLNGCCEFGEGVTHSEVNSSGMREINLSVVMLSLVEMICLLFSKAKGATNKNASQFSPHIAVFAFGAPRGSRVHDSSRYVVARVSLFVWTDSAHEL